MAGLLGGVMTPGPTRVRDEERRAQRGSRGLLGAVGEPMSYAPNPVVAALGQGLLGAQYLTGEKPLNEGLASLSDMTAMLIGSQVPAPMRRIFAGVKAATANKEMLKKAEELDKAGVDNRSIWQQTGWFKGPEGKWKFEIDDSTAKFTPTKWDRPWKEAPNVEEALMGDALAHDPLYSAYPTFKGMNVVLNPNIKPLGEYHEPRGSLGLNEYVQMQIDRPRKLNWEVQYLKDSKNPASDAYWKKGVQEALAENPSRPKNEVKREFINFMRDEQRGIDELKAGMLWPSNAQSYPKSTLLHEAQHGVQYREGFAQGGNPEGMQSLVETRRVLESLNKQTADLHEQAGFVDWLTKNYGSRGPNETLSDMKERFYKEAKPELYQDWRRLNDQMQSIQQTWPEIAFGIQDVSANGLYRRLAGEAEARAVQSRMNMTPKQRGLLFPLDSYDVPLDQLIIR